MSKVIILGAGMIGRAIAIDLAKNHRVTSADQDAGALNFFSRYPEINTLKLDVSDFAALHSAVKDTDLVISAVPGFLGFNTVQQIIGLRKNIVDISFMSEDYSELDPEAKKHDVTVITDCGVAPGLPNYIAGYLNELMKIESLECFVGGLPKRRTFPFEYKAPFSPADVIEEYMRPARYIENGELVTKPAMSDPEYIDFDNIGTLEAFNTDGLRSLTMTMSHVPHMKEKTLRYPGHIRQIQALKAAGFFDKMAVEVNGLRVVPFDFTSRILFRSWKAGDNEPEFTIMRVTVNGTENGMKKSVVYDLYDEFDPVEVLSSMARTTGFTAAATAELVLSGKFREKGVFPPELIGRHKICFDHVMDYLEKRNVRFKVSTNPNCH